MAKRSKSRKKPQSIGSLAQKAVRYAETQRRLADLRRRQQLELTTRIMSIKPLEQIKREYKALPMPVAATPALAGSRSDHKSEQIKQDVRALKCKSRPAPTAGNGQSRKVPWCT